MPTENEIGKYFSAIYEEYQDLITNWLKAHLPFYNLPANFPYSAEDIWQETMMHVWALMQLNSTSRKDKAKNELRNKMLERCIKNKCNMPKNTDINAIDLHLTIEQGQISINELNKFKLETVLKEKAKDYSIDTYEVITRENYDFWIDEIKILFQNYYKFVIKQIAKDLSDKEMQKYELLKKYENDPVLLQKVIEYHVKDVVINNSFKYYCIFNTIKFGCDNEIIRRLLYTFTANKMIDLIRKSHPDKIIENYGGGIVVVNSDGKIVAKIHQEETLVPSRRITNWETEAKLRGYLKDFFNGLSGRSKLIVCLQYFKGEDEKSEEEDEKNKLSEDDINAIVDICYKLKNGGSYGKNTNNHYWNEVIWKQLEKFCKKNENILKLLFSIYKDEIEEITTELEQISGEFTLQELADKFFERLNDNMSSEDTPNNTKKRLLLERIGANGRRSKTPNNTKKRLLLELYFDKWTISDWEDYLYSIVIEDNIGNSTKFSVRQQNILKLRHVEHKTVEESCKGLGISIEEYTNEWESLVKSDNLFNLYTQEFYIPEEIAKLSERQQKIINLSRKPNATLESITTFLCNYPGYKKIFEALESKDNIIGDMFDKFTKLQLQILKLTYLEFKDLEEIFNEEDIIKELEVSLEDLPEDVKKKCETTDYRKEFITSEFAKAICELDKIVVQNDLFKPEDIAFRDVIKDFFMAMEQLRASYLIRNNINY